MQLYREQIKLDHSGSKSVTEHLYTAFTFAPSSHVCPQLSLFIFNPRFPCNRY